MTIEISNLTKLYGGTVAVKDLTINVKAGELYAFLGPNGAGKTTAIKVVVGLLHPTRGSVRVGGFDLEHDGIAARKILSYVPDQPFLYEKLSGREFLVFVGRMYGMDADTTRRKIDQLSERFGTRSYLDDLSESYSHGMRQRVVLSAAILHDPRVLVVDEPMVGLDPRSTRLVKEVLRECVDKGTSVLMSTHTLSVAEEVADKIGIIHKGALVAEGTVDELHALGHTSGKLENVFLALTEDDDTREYLPAGDSDG